MHFVAAVFCLLRPDYFAKCFRQVWVILVFKCTLDDLIELLGSNNLVVLISNLSYEVVGKGNLGHSVEKGNPHVKDVAFDNNRILPVAKDRVGLARSSNFPSRFGA